jgi:hypothetical protein
MIAKFLDMRVQNSLWIKFNGGKIQFLEGKGKKGVVIMKKGI